MKTTASKSSELGEPRSEILSSQHSALSPLAIYVHTPFCPSKCGYCDFNSYAMTGEIMERTTQAQVAEIERSPWRGRPAKTIFFGGGTPTFLSEDQLLQILEAVMRVHPPIEGAEITSEANPGTADATKFSAMRRAGFNRISLGAQSFLDSDLLRLGRIHKSGEIERAVSIAREAGFENLNLDLMFALPGQSRHAWRANLERALALAPEHISLYCLTIEQNTPFYKQQLSGQLQLPDDDEQVAMYNECCETTAAAGYDQYEISNFAKPGLDCKHNLCYWRAEEYAGYGPGAVGAVEMRPLDDPSPAARPYPQMSNRLVAAGEAMSSVSFDPILSCTKDCEQNELGGGEVRGAPILTSRKSTAPTREGVRKVRYTNLKHPERYCAAVENGDRIAFESEELSEATLRVERIMLGLRLNSGLDIAGMDLPGEKIDLLLNRGWIGRSEDVIRLTPEGKHFCSEVALELI